MKILCIIIAFLSMLILIGFTMAHSDISDAMIIVCIIFGAIFSLISGFSIDPRMPIWINFGSFMFGFILLAGLMRSVGDMEIFIYIGKLTWLLNGLMYAVIFALLGLIIGGRSSSQ